MNFQDKLKSKWYCSKGTVDCDDDVWRLVISTEYIQNGECSFEDTRVVSQNAFDVEEGTEEIFNHIVEIHNASLEKESK
tara:strand:- start:68 stop:304 length:237 start_codon:yes stop_codon:yes gene_type:complete